MFRTAIEAEILYQALYVHVQRLNTSLTKCQTRYCMEPRPSVDDCKVMRFLGAVIKPVHPCTGLIARFAQQNALLLRTTDIRVGTKKDCVVMMIVERIIGLVAIIFMLEGRIIFL